MRSLWSDQGYMILPPLLTIFLEVLAVVTGKKNKQQVYRLERKKQNFLFAEYGIVDVENPNESAKKLLE